jgi:hypothetical protein
MTKEIIVKIIDSLYEGTKDGAVNWQLRKSMFNSETRNLMHSFSIDNKTEFRIEIRLDDNLTFSPGELLSIYNESITDGVKYISHYENPTLKDLELLIYYKYIRPNIKSRNDVLIYEDILKNIGDREYIRDKKLNSILGETEIKEEVKEEVKKKRFFLW